MAEISLDPPASYEPQIKSFTGRLKSLEKEVEDGDYGKRELLYFEFDELEVHEADSPYTLPTFTIRVTYSSRANQPWDELRKSIVLVLPDEANRDPGWLVGKKLNMVWSPCQLNRPDEAGNWALRDAHAWMLQGIEGVSSEPPASLKEAFAEALIDTEPGKELEVFFATASLANLPDYKEASNKVQDGSLVAEMVSDGLIKETDGVYTKA